MRLQQSLAGSWQFQIDPEGTAQVGTLRPDRTIPVPMPWQAAFPELEPYSGYAWYQREVLLDAAWLDGEVLLTFGAVDYWCEVFVNGRTVGTHEGGYTAFTLPIRAALVAGRNVISVRVYDSAQNGGAPVRWLGQGRPDSAEPPFDPLQVPHGKQDWYLNAGGIWQDVTLAAVPAAYLDQVHVTPDIHTGRAEIAVHIAGQGAAMAGALQATIGGQSTTVPLVAGQSNYTLRITVPNPQLWELDAPHLYTTAVSLSTPAGEDTQTVRFGLREISYRGGMLLLNGRPIYLRAALDQDMYPETIYTVPSEAFMRDEFRKAKELGLNCLRCHIKPPDPLYLDLADEMGLLVWAEIPSWRTFYLKTTTHVDHFNNNDLTRGRVRQTLIEMIRRDYNHPSLVIWTIVNEDWGTALALSASDRAWVIEMFNLCKKLDPTRLVVDNSACLNGWGPNIHVKSDLDDFHIYTNIPDNAPFFTQFIEQFSLRPTWTYSNHGDSSRTGEEPLILSEFGNWGLPSVAALSDADGNPPDWFKLGPWWSGWDGEPGWPQDVVARFKRLGLDRIWADYEAFAAASQWHQYQAMKYEIEVMRRQPALQGYVITELSDIYWESNGLLDFNRGPKAYHGVFSAINADDVIVPQIARYATWDDQPLMYTLYASRYSAADWAGAALEISASATTTSQKLVKTPQQGEVIELGQFKQPLAVDKSAAEQTIKLAIRGTDGTVLAHNEFSVMVIPASARKATYRGLVTVGGSATNPATETAQAALSGLGYRTTPHLTAGAILVASQPTAETLRWVRDGGKLFYECHAVSPFFWVQGRGGSYGGNWITSFNWLAPAIYPRLAIGNPSLMPFSGVAPTGVITGLPVEDARYHADFLAGQFTGWVRHPAIHTVQFQYGKGVVLMTTYNLSASLHSASPDPVAIAMFHDLIDHLASDRCRPALVTNL